MAKEEAWKKAKGYLYDTLSGEEADEIIKALEQEPCDVISRERALAPYKDLNNDDVISVRLIKKNIAELPSFTPIPVPDNASNREVFEKIMDYMFMDDARITTDKHGYLHLRGVKEDWLNAPYKAKSEKKNDTGRI